MKNKKELKIGSLSISIFIFILLNSLIFISWNDFITQKYANDTFEQILFEKSLKSNKLKKSPDTDSMPEFTKIIEVFSNYKEYINVRLSPESQQAAREKINNGRPLIMLMFFFIFIALSLIRGWNNIKKHIKEIEESQLSNLIINTYKNIKWYIGSHTYSYGFRIKRIVVGTDFLIASPEMKAFMINHEIFHLENKDSIVKNFIINIRKFFLPIWFFIIWLSSVYSAYWAALPYMGAFVTESAQQGFAKYNDLTFEKYSKFLCLGIVILFAYMVFPIIVIILLNRALSSTNKWFSVVKEYLADKYALTVTGYIPEIANKADKYHPSGIERAHFLKGRKRMIDAFPVLFIYFLIINLRFASPIVCSDIYSEIIWQALLIYLLFFVIWDLLFLKLHFLSFKGFTYLLLIFLLFIFWNIFALIIHRYNNTWFYYEEIHGINILLNIASIIIVFSFFLTTTLIRKK